MHYMFFTHSQASWANRFIFMEEDAIVGNNYPANKAAMLPHGAQPYNDEYQDIT